MSNHWLAKIAARAGLAGADGLEMNSSVDLEEAWEKVAKRCGISQAELATVVADTLHLEVAELNSAEPNITRLVPEGVARKLFVFPIRDSYRNIVVATCDPTNLDLEQMVRFSSGRDPVIEVAPPKGLLDAINLHYSSEHTVEMVLEGLEAAEVGGVSVIDDVQPEDGNVEEEASAAPVIKLTNLILRDAVRQRASDIHFEPGYSQGAVRFRVDGVLRKYMQMPMPALRRVVSRIKILGKMDIADKLRPQDGRARILVDNAAYDLRLSTVPTGESEKLVVRVLNTLKSLNLKDLSLSGSAVSHLRNLLTSRNSMVIVTGPTGSGKTTTLYAALLDLASSEINVMTVEDPVEYDLPGVAQIQVESRQGVTFASVLRSILRQDPDVILIGEIRDLETAQIAVQASMTGHLVLATLHTNDAPSVVSRLADLGLDRAAIADCLRGVVAQRLVRSVCPECSETVSSPLTPEEERLSLAYGVQPGMRTTGCSRCTHTGYLGRLPVIEVFEVFPELKEMIANGSAPSHLESAARAKGYKTMLDDALDRVRDDQTTLQEVMRVLGKREGDILAQSSTTTNRVLIVDDDPVIRVQTRGLLEKSGYSVSEADDGAEALETLKRDPGFSLVVTDLNMPEVGGREVLSTLRKNACTSGLPVIVLTGSSNVGGEAELIEEGADDYIRKPIDPASFIARIRATMRRAA